LTTNTQPVMLVAAVAAWRVWLSEGGAAPAAVAGHSLGEYSALVAAEVLTLAQAAPLVRLRASAMQAAVPVGVGAMAAILGMGAEQVRAGCVQAQATFGPGSAEVVEAVNFNDPAQTVIAGSKAAVEKACEVLKANGAKRALILPVSAPFHSSLMKPAAEQLREALANLSLAQPRIPVINNIDVAIETDADRIRDALYRQAFGPVRWVECVGAIKALGIQTFVECGPGKVLAGMTKRIDADLTGVALLDPASLAEVKALLA
jgi:[acyl-carrier-protein] S-malonyltransferase